MRAPQISKQVVGFGIKIDCLCSGINNNKPSIIYNDILFAYIISENILHKKVLIE